MKTRELFDREHGRVFSFEIFPPKRTYPIETIYSTLEGLSDLRPDFISVTFSAGGSANNDATIEIADRIKRTYGIESVAHLACVNLTRDDVRDLLLKLKAHGIDNILALRGDRVPGIEPSRDFEYATDLIRFIREQPGYDFDIVGACYPETHAEAASPQDDIMHLKEKQDAGASHLITQLFFDNEVFYRFLERARAAGITVPIEPGIMPVINRRQIERMTTLCGASLPRKFTRMMERFDGNPIAMRDAGIAYAIDQIVDLLACDVDGIHLYAMNNPYVVRRIDTACRSLFNA